MSEEKKKAQEKTPEIKSKSPFIHRIIAPKHGEFDKYYYEAEERIVFKDSGEIDPDTGEHLGVQQSKFIVKKTDIAELINSQADSVGVASYMKALTLQGTPIEDFSTDVDCSKVSDFIDVPEDKFEGTLYGDRALEIFKDLPSELKGNHTTINGFLKSLTKESVDNFIRGRVEALMPKQVDKEGE